MSRRLESPVETQRAVPALNRALSSEYPAKSRSPGRTAGGKRVFVQTDTGCVLGIELDRGDSAHTVKRKLQLALNIPTEQSSLTFGDQVLTNDLSTIRNDSPLLLTKTFMHRSSSTPCLSPTGKDTQQRDRSGPIEVLVSPIRCSRTKQLVEDVARAIRNGVDPIAVHNGLGGAYYFKNIKGENVAIVKPNDEEPFAPNNPKGFTGKALGQPGLKRSVRVGETGFREVAAYLLDYGNSANVPPTVLVKISHPVFHVNEGVGTTNRRAKDVDPPAVSKIASFQQFVPHDFDASDYGTSSFPVSAVHRIGILDIRIFNTDRHAGNLLVRKLDTGGGRFGYQTELIPIDHGLCLPESLEDPYFEWIHWPQALIPFSEDELEYIANLDPARDADMLRLELPMIREACLRVLVLSTIFLKEATAFGLCLAEIGEMMSREFTGMEDQPSELEVVCMEARRLATEREEYFIEDGSGDEDVMQFDIEFEDDPPVHKALPAYHFEFKGWSSRNSLAKLEEAIVEHAEDDSEEKESNAGNFACPKLVNKRLTDISKLSTSLNGITLSEKSQRHLLAIPKGADSSPRAADSSNRTGSGSQGGNWRSANEQLPTSATFVKLADMGDETWLLFLEKFQDLLPRAFRGRKYGAPKQRLGTSCQF